ncbi:winged helix-turn-helix transcriptional regulator [Candidatus Bathyarchaeota archaeon]|nr:MAG: winged helix-turn-helix transcriptional regulator [Candidatus Bathyarchaeota archaeon]
MERALGVQGNSRVRVKQLVSLAPGVHLRELQRLLGMSFNSTRYHVDKLTTAGEIIRVEEGGYSRLYPAGISEAERAIFTLVRGETDRKILASLVADPILSNKQLCEQTNLAKSTVSEHLTGLVRAGIVKTRQVTENFVAYELEQPDQIRFLLRSQNPSILKKASDRFIDLWDF